MVLEMERKLKHPKGAWRNLGADGGREGPRDRGDDLGLQSDSAAGCPGVSLKRVGAQVRMFLDIWIY